jgi:large subunit ribosomal protein L22
MGKPKSKRRLPDDAAKAKAASIRTSARKLNLVAASIRGKNAGAALTQLSFEKRRIAQDVKKVLQSAIANAENNHNLDVDKLYVAEAWVGRSFVMKRFRARARGRSAGIEKPFSNLTIIVREREGEEKKAKRTPAKDEGKKETVKKTTKGTGKTASKAAPKKKATTKGAAQAAAGA